MLSGSGWKEVITPVYEIHVTIRKKDIVTFSVERGHFLGWIVKGPH
jgi:hypothetical protein